jgi:hypothetical protein
LRSYRHWTARYILDRTKRWLYERTHRDSPWLTRQMVEILDRRLRPSDTLVEWGSGRSTIWFARRVGHVVSVEHDRAWHSRVRAKLKESNLRNVECHLVREGQSVQAVGHITRGTVDVALVDGLDRDRCALAAVDLLKAGGLLIVDNANWYLPCQSRSPKSTSPDDGPVSEAWAEFSDATRQWPLTWTTDGVTDTAMWMKPD